MTAAPRFDNSPVLANLVTRMQVLARTSTHQFIASRQWLTLSLILFGCGFLNPSPSNAQDNRSKAQSSGSSNNTVLATPSNQNGIQVSGQTGEQVTRQKPVIPTYFSTSIDDPTAVTRVPLDASIEKIARGLDPKSKKELVALQKQQTEVTKRLPLVTVNLQHGNTQGSGVIVSGDGYILTAAHVAGKPKQKINVVLHDGTRVEGISMGLNRNEDAGLVKIVSSSRSPDNAWPHANLGSAADLPNGSWVIAVGHPGGWQHDRPAVVRIGRLLRNVNSTLITDCALIGGDSGGPLFDLEGRLIGIHSRIGVDVDENMHVPLDVFYKSHERLIRSEAWCSLPGFRPFIGVEGVTEAEANGRCIIERVSPKSPADRAGIQPGDVIVRFDGQSIGAFKELKDAVDSMVPGDSITVEVERKNQHVTLRLVVGSLTP